MSPPATVAVAIPVRDEAERLPRLFAALARQRSAIRFHLFLRFDGCTDGGHRLASDQAPHVPFPVDIDLGERDGAPNAGLARRRACAIALARMPEAILFTTDADCEPDADWIGAGIAGLERADIVCGRIAPSGDDASPLQGDIGRYLDRLHTLRRSLDPVAWEDDSTHHWTSAASLAFAPGVYRDLGGFAPLPSGEDAELCDRAWRRGYRLRRDGHVVVHTSSRRDGRTDGGFAGHLASLDRADATPMVAHPADEMWRYRRHALARRSFDVGDWASVARAAALDPSDVQRVAAEVANGDAFAARIIGSPPHGMRAIPLALAERLLDGLEIAVMTTAA